MSQFALLITYDHLRWSLATARLEHKCVLSGRPINPGDRIYRPLTNGNRRMDRVRADVAARYPDLCRPLEDENTRDENSEPQEPLMHEGNSPK